MKVQVAVTVLRDDGTQLTRTETVANDQSWTLNRPVRMTKAQLRKSIDARVAAALNAMGVR